MKIIPHLALHHVMHNQQKYQMPFPMMFDDTLTQLEKMNRLTSHLHAMDVKLHDVVIHVENIGNIVNENIKEMECDINHFKKATTEQIEEFERMMYEYYMPQSVEIILQEWWENGKLAEIINDNILTEINQKLDNSVKKNTLTYYAPDWGFIGDGVFDNSDVWDAFSLIAPEGITLTFDIGEYFFSRELVISKHIHLQGKGMMLGSTVNGSKLQFRNTNGINIQRSYLTLKNITISGADKPSITWEDVKNKNLNSATRGIYCSFSPTINSGGLRMSNTSVSRFNLGLSMDNGTGNWAGAYREFADCIINYNDVGVYVLNGATHNKFTGGVVSNNEIHGVFADCETQYNNLEFTGTTFELNGHQGSFAQGTPENHGVYVGKDSIVNFNQCYFELMNMYAAERGVITNAMSHIHNNVKIYGRGAIKDLASYAPFSNDKKYVRSIVDSFNFIDCVGTGLFNNANSVSITSNVLGRPRIQSHTVPLRGLYGHNLKGIKLSFSLLLLSNPAPVRIRPTFTIRDSDSGIDNSNINLTYPEELFRPEQGKPMMVEIFYRPRMVEGYLNPEALLTDMSVIIEFSANADYTTNNLNLQLFNPVITFFTTEDFNPMQDVAIKREAASSNLPALQSTNRADFCWNTTLQQPMWWTGTKWVTVAVSDV